MRELTGKAKELIEQHTRKAVASNKRLKEARAIRGQTIRSIKAEDVNPPAQQLNYKLKYPLSKAFYAINYEEVIKEEVGVYQRNTLRHNIKDRMFERPPFIGGTSRIITVLKPNIRGKCYRLEPYLPMQLPFRAF